jgi:hypothetical protein
MRALALVIALSSVSGAASAAEINAFVSTAIKAATDELLPPFERANGHTIAPAMRPPARCCRASSAASRSMCS